MNTSTSGIDHGKTGFWPAGRRLTVLLLAILFPGLGAFGPNSFGSAH